MTEQHLDMIHKVSITQVLLATVKDVESFALTDRQYRSYLALPSDQQREFLLDFGEPLGQTTEIIEVHKGPVMDSRLFYILLHLHMTDDPTVLSAEDDHYMEQVLNAESQRRGFAGWVDAYHEFTVEQSLDI